MTIRMPSAARAFTYVLTSAICWNSLADDRPRVLQLPPAPKLPTVQQVVQETEPPPKPPAFTDPAEAGEDYLIQGEYTGQVAVDGVDTWYGVQVVAGGEGTFDVVILHGGLPGNGWDGTSREQVSAESAEEQLTFPWGDGAAELSDKKIHVSNASGESIGRLSKVVRKSRTLGLPAPPHAIVLFDGSNADAFEGGQMTEDGLSCRALPVTKSSRTSGCTSSGARRSCRRLAVRRVATAVLTCRGGTKCRCSTRSA
ncbi:MAG: hypothetical protein R3B91_01550 [Planctomycetaceae bacterium]